MAKITNTSIIKRAGNWVLKNFTSYDPDQKAVAPRQPRPSAYYEGHLYGSGVYNLPYDGEKNPGELGPVINYTVNHDILRMRSWQLYLESEVCQTVIKRLSRWVIGNGLKLQAEPQKEALLSEKINIDPEQFNKVVESRFRLFANSRTADYANMKNLHDLADECFINTKVAGDMLVVLRYLNGVKVELIDAAHIRTPLDAQFTGGEYKSTNGNRIRNGIEMNKRGETVAYHVRTATGLEVKSKRIPARGAGSGNLMAYMVSGQKYRKDSNRAMPLLSVVFETIKKMERYKEAMVGSAEERAKIAYFIIHGKNSSEEDPFADNILKKGDVRDTDNVVDASAEGERVARTVQMTTNKTTVNMPMDADIKSLEADNELYFKDFITTLIDLVCAAVDIPPNVALSKYDSNYSASRAALKDWEHTLMVERKKFYDQFYLPIYWFWLDTEILSNKIDAPGYLQARSSRNIMALEAYRFARFVGANVPHIDPEKEVRAQRLALGQLADAIPLTTVEAATEALNNGDFKNNIGQFGEELMEAKERGIEQAPPPPPPNNNAPNDNNQQEEEDDAEEPA